MTTNINHSIKKVEKYTDPTLRTLALVLRAEKLEEPGADTSENLGCILIKLWQGDLLFQSLLDGRHSGVSGPRVDIELFNRRLISVRK